MSFYDWWIEEFGRPPLPNEVHLFECCQRAYECGQSEGLSLPSHEERRDQLRAWNEDAVIFEDYKEALVGICFRFGADPIAVYDMSHCIDLLIRRGCHFEQASDVVWSDVSSWLGESTPVFMQFFR